MHQPLTPNELPVASGFDVAGARRVRSWEFAKVIGTSLGSYKIIEQLGAGGMGEVYRVRAPLDGC